MTTTQPIHTSTATPKVALTAGSAFTFGFFGALGVFVFYLVVTVVLTVVALVLAAAGLLDWVLPYFPR